MTPKPSYRIEDQDGRLIVQTYDGEVWAKRLAAVIEGSYLLNPEGLNRYYVRKVKDDE